MNTEVLVCPLQRFQDAYLPFVPTEHDVSACLHQLTESGLLAQDSASVLRWRDFPESPSDEGRPEQQVFSALEKIAKKVAKHTFPPSAAPGRHKKPHLQYQDCPYTTLASEIQGANFKVDGCFRLNKASKLLSSSTSLLAPDTVVVAEYKKCLNESVDNRLKVVSAASHIMNDDPRRIFMFGITIEDTMVSLWYFSRSHSTKSEPFDFIKDPQSLISIFLSFLFGTEEGLGYDPAVRRCNGTPIYYEYEVSGEHGKRYYRTRGALSSYRSLGITGRMMRVWRAVQVSGFGGAVVSEKEVALKDVWLNNNARTEASIQQEIFKAVDSELQKHEEKRESRLDLIKPWPSSIRGRVLDIIRKKTYRDFFLEISFDGQGATTKGKPLDATPTLGLFTPESKSIDSRSRQIPDSDRSRSVGSYIRPSYLKSEATVDMEVHQNRRYLPRRRNHLIFNDICTALHDAADLKTSFLVLNDAWIALAIMFVANWVHRDISSGNILFVGEGKLARGKLSDLEYAKPFMSDSPHSADPKTGTPFFMAYELLVSRLIHLAEVDRPARNSSHRNLAVAMDILATPGQESPSRQGPSPSASTAVPLYLSGDLAEQGSLSDKPVIYNFQHDLESLWWIALWILLARIVHEASQKYAKHVYINRLGCPEERSRVFLVRGHLVDKLKVVLHQNLTSFIEILENLRLSLLSSYRTLEKEDRVDDAHAYSNVYSDVMLGLVDCFTAAYHIQNTPSLVNLHPRPPPITQASDIEPTARETSSLAPSSPRKRGRSSDTGEADAAQSESAVAKMARTTN